MGSHNPLISALFQQVEAAVSRRAQVVSSMEDPNSNNNNNNLTRPNNPRCIRVNHFPAIWTRISPIAGAVQGRRLTQALIVEVPRAITSYSILQRGLHSSTSHSGSSFKGNSNSTRCDRANTAHRLHHKGDLNLSSSFRT